MTLPLLPMLSSRAAPAPMLALGATATTAQESFDKELQAVKSLDDFVALMTKQSPGFFNWLYLQAVTPGNPPTNVFERIVETFRKPALRDVGAKDNVKFTRLMTAMPILAIVNPDGSTASTAEVFDMLPPASRESCFVDIFGKWLDVWPVNARLLPNQFAAWLSGNMPGTTTTADDLKFYRTQALDSIYNQWLTNGQAAGGAANDNASNIQELMKNVKNYDDFVFVEQLVFPEFWLWPEAMDPDRVNKRQQIWSRLLVLWRGVRARNTGWVDVPFLQMWSVANSQGWPTQEERKLDQLKGGQPAGTGRRGRIWA